MVSLSRSYTCILSLSLKSSSAVWSVGLQVLLSELHSFHSLILGSLLLSSFTTSLSPLLGWGHDAAFALARLRNDGGTIAILDHALRPVVAHILHAPFVGSLFFDRLEVILAHQRHLSWKIRLFLFIWDSGSRILLCIYLGSWLFLPLTCRAETRFFMQLSSSICGWDIRVEGARVFHIICWRYRGLVQEGLSFGFVCIEVLWLIKLLGGFAPEAGASNAINKDSPVSLFVEIWVLPRFGFPNNSLILLVLTHFLLGLDWHVLALRSGNTLPGSLLSKWFDWLNCDLSTSRSDACDLLDLYDLKITLSLIIFPGTFF